jgi:hypothetical protein
MRCRSTTTAAREATIHWGARKGDVVSSYDFEAADWLSRQLAKLEWNANWFQWIRGQQYKSFLGSEKSDNWAGPRRHKFETDFTNGQKALAQLAALAKEAKQAVDTATGQAHIAAQNKRHH